MHWWQPTGPVLGMKETADTKPTEIKCPACGGTGYPVVIQPVLPGRKIYPAPCKKCGGKGRIAEAATEAASFENPSVIASHPRRRSCGTSPASRGVAEGL